MSEENYYRSKLRSLGFIAKEHKTRTTLVHDENEPGRIAGAQIEHKSGRVDAVVTPKPVRLRASMTEPGMERQTSVPTKTVGASVSVHKPGESHG